MILRNRNLLSVGLLLGSWSSVAAAHCDCIDVSGIVDRGLEERAIRTVQRDSGAYRTDVVLQSVELCDGKLVFRGKLPENRTFEVDVPAAKWDEIRATIGNSASPATKKPGK
jgi:hypothetical protein